jgi:hypothetical protein
MRGPCPCTPDEPKENDMTRTPATSGPDQPPTLVFAGVDTHKELHVAAVIGAGETMLGTRSFPTTLTGYRAMLAWIGEFGDLARVGVEGTGSHGAA